MEFKGTKGKWKLGDEKYYNGNKAFEVWYGEDGECIAEVVHKIEDAKLISCAPEMLLDLNDLVWLIENRATYEELIERIEPSKQLIKKATI